MDHATTKLYELSPTPILYVAPCDLMLGRVPLFPLFLKGNAAPTLPHSCDTSRAARSSSEPPTQPQRMAVGGATCTRSTRGCGSLGARGLALGACPCLRPRKGATRSSGQIRRGVTRPVAAARQPGAEMNETYGMCAFEVISQDNSV